MDNPEFIELRNRFLFGLLIATIVVFIGILLFSNKFGNMRSNALEAINKNETFLLLVIDNKNCEVCDGISNRLDRLEIDYIAYDIYGAKDLDDICLKLGINKNNFKTPSLIYIKDGKKTGSILGVADEEELDRFLSSYGFISGEGMEL